MERIRKKREVLKSITDNLFTTVGELIGENETLINNPVFGNSDIKFVEANSSGTELFLLPNHYMNRQMDTYLLRFKKNRFRRIILRIKKSGYLLCEIRSCKINP